MQREERQSEERPRPRFVGERADPSSARGSPGALPPGDAHDAPLEKRAEPPVIETRLPGRPLHVSSDEASNAQVRWRMRVVLLISLALAILGALIYALMQ